MWEQQDRAPTWGFCRMQEQSGKIAGSARFKDYAAKKNMQPLSCQKAPNEDAHINRIGLSLRPKSM